LDGISVSNRFKTAYLEIKETHRLHALDLGWLVWIVGVDGERERESTTFIHAWQV
jgi:hypothetical protein